MPSAGNGLGAMRLPHLFIYYFPTQQDGEKRFLLGTIRLTSGAFIIDNATPLFYTFSPS
jgi:hypothetical protein